MSIGTTIVPCHGGRIPEEKLVELWQGSAACARIYGQAGKSVHAVIKPNWLQSGREDQPSVWKPVITDPDLVVTMARLVAESLGGTSILTLADAPHTYADFAGILARGALDEKLKELQCQHSRMTLEILDLRRELWTCRENVIVDRRANALDPRGYVKINLGRESLLFGFRGEGRYYGADYDAEEVCRHHQGEVQEYLLAGSVLQGDVFINIPKLKTHKKTGISSALKNLVGINGDKNWLPHCTRGAPENGGDEFESLGMEQAAEGMLKRMAQKLVLPAPGVGSWMYRKMRGVGVSMLGDSGSVIRNGNWMGNDTCWRMVLDLNRALLYGHPDGSMGEERRAYFGVVDAMVAGEGDGPLCPDPVEMNVLVVGENAAEMDAVCCRLMGFDPEEIPMVREAFALHRWPLASCRMGDVRVRDDRVGREISLKEVQPGVKGGCRPHFGWSRLRRG